MSREKDVKTPFSRFCSHSPRRRTDAAKTVRTVREACFNRLKSRKHNGYSGKISNIQDFRLDAEVADIEFKVFFSPSKSPVIVFISQNIQQKEQSAFQNEIRLLQNAQVAFDLGQNGNTLKKVIFL